MSKLSNTDALTKAGALRPGHQSREVRKVGGGHIVRESRWDENGGGSCHEEFVPKGAKAVGESSLADAIKEVKR